MGALVYGVAIVAAGFLAHLAIWRVRVPRRQTRAVLAVFFGTMLAGLALPSVAPVPPPGGPAEYAAVVLFVVAMTLGYTITYSALEADSPTLVLIRLIAAAGPDGLSEKELEAGADDGLLILPRLADLVRDGHVTRDGDVYQLTEKGRRFVAVFRTFRRVLGADKGG